MFVYYTCTFYVLTTLFLVLHSEKNFHPLFFELEDCKQRSQIVFETEVYTTKYTRT